MEAKILKLLGETAKRIPNQSTVIYRVKHIKRPGDGSKSYHKVFLEPIFLDSNVAQNHVRVVQITFSDRGRELSTINLDEMHNQMAQESWTGYDYWSDSAIVKSFDNLRKTFGFANLTPGQLKEGQNTFIFAGPCGVGKTYNAKLFGRKIGQHVPVSTTRKKRENEVSSTRNLNMVDISISGDNLEDRWAKYIEKLRARASICHFMCKTTGESYGLFEEIFGQAIREKRQHNGNWLFMGCGIEFATLIKGSFVSKKQLSPLPTIVYQFPADYEILYQWEREKSGNLDPTRVNYHLKIGESKILQADYVVILVSDNRNELQIANERIIKSLK